MRRITLSILISLPLFAAAQEVTTVTSAEAAPTTQQITAEPSLSIAVFSYEKCWEAMPEVTKVKAEIATLHDQYAAELKRAEADFNAKYEDFLEQQSKLASSIRNKRQAELQKIMEENLAFKAKSQETLASTEVAKLAPIKEKLQQVIEKVAKDGKYNMVMNRDNGTIPFIDNVRIVDITDAIIAKLK